MIKARKSTIASVLVFALFITISNSADAQSHISIDSTRKQLDKLIASADPADQQILNGKLALLAQSDQESEMTVAAQYYYRIKKTKISDSIYIVEATKFPKGMQARSNAQQLIYKLKELPEIEAAYLKWVKEFPPESYPSLPLGEDRVSYDYLRSDLARRYAKEKNTAKAIYYTNLLEADFWKGNGYKSVADAFYSTGDLKNATLYTKMAMESAASYTDDKRGASPAAKFAAIGYSGLTGDYARLLFEQKQYNEALKYIALAVKANPQRKEYNYRYAEILFALKKYQEAFDRMEVAVKSGTATQEMADLLKVLYVKVKGSERGFEIYQEDIRKGIISDIQKRLVKDIVNEPAADFTLTDLQGNKVSLNDFKGKTVVIDFWATWCVPCKASFPAMQMAVNKYKDDPNVNFLFIHTWEKEANPTQDARAYVESMKYNFEVLMDLKDPDTKINKVVSSYHVYGIPAKFVVDRNGNIRFKLTGFEGSNQAAVDEISMMIDMAKAKS